MRGVDYYELLGVHPSATAMEIKTAYRALAKIMHPDAGGTSGTFRLLREAYDTLADPVRRADYDRSGRTADRPTAERPRTERPGTERPRTERTATARKAAPREKVEPPEDSATMRRRKRPRDDPGFVPTVPVLRDLPWMHELDLSNRVRYLPRTGPSRELVLGAIGGWVGLLAPVLLFDLTPLLLVLWLGLVAAAAVGVLRLARRHVAAVRAERAFAARFGARIVFGKPEPGEIAEQLTAQLLGKYLTCLPGARIFHGLSWPGSVFSDVHHAVLCGRRLVLIESKLWLPGHYAADPDVEGELWRNGHPFRGGGTRLPEGVEAYRELLPDVEVRGALLIYPSRAGQITTGDSHHAVAPPMTPDQLILEIGEWLATEATVIDRDAFSFVRSQVVS